MVGGDKKYIHCEEKGQSFCAKRVSLLNKIKSHTSNSPETKTAVQSSQLIRLLSFDPSLRDFKYAIIKTYP